MVLAVDFEIDNSIGNNGTGHESLLSSLEKNLPHSPLYTNPRTGTKNN
jgi:hypothetical protein